MVLAQSSLRSSVFTHSARTLEERVSGEVLYEGDDGYDDARKLQNTAIDRRPTVIVRATGANDVAAAVRFAREHDLAIAVRSGGHSIPGLSMVDDGMTIDLSGMKQITFDIERETVTAQPGVRSDDLAGPASELGFALTTGDAGTVGLGGLTLGGGIGWLVRKHGLTIDHLLSAEVVTADGQVLRASANENADLFWAIRGGGGNFGIITRFEFRLARVNMIYGGILVLPGTHEVVRRFAEVAATADENLTLIAMLMKAPPAPFIPEDKVGSRIFGVWVCYDGDAEAAERALAPLRAVAEPIADVLQVMPYPAMYDFTREATVPHRLEIRSMFMDEISDDLIARSLAAIDNAKTPMAAVQFRGLGGAFGRVDNDATAFAHRDRKFFLAILGLWMDEADDEVNSNWTKDLWDDIKAEAQGVYVNFLQDEPERITDAYPPATHERLREIKRRYDPENVFRLNQNIRLD